MMSSKRNTDSTIVLDLAEFSNRTAGVLQKKLEEIAFELIKDKIKDMFQVEYVTSSNGWCDLTDEQKARHKYTRPYGGRYLSTLYPKAIAPLVISLDKAAENCTASFASLVPALYDEAYRKALQEAITKKAQHDANKFVFSGKPPKQPGS